MRLLNPIFRVLICFSLVFTTSFVGAKLYAGNTADEKIQELITSTQESIDTAKQGLGASYSERSANEVLVELGEALDTLAKNPSKLSPLAKANAKFANVLENNIVKNDLEIFEKLVVLSKLSFDRVMESPEEKKVGERAVELLGSVGKMIYAANEPFEDVVRRPNTNNYYNYKNIINNKMIL